MDIKDFEDKATALRRGPLKAKSLLMATSPLANRRPGLALCHFISDA